MKPDYQVLMLGSTLDTKGGMVSVVSSYKKWGLFNAGILYISSHQDGQTFPKTLLFLKALLQFIGAILIHPRISIIHMHVSEKGSFVRKSIFLILAKLFGKKVIFHMHGAEFIPFYQSLPLFFKFLVRKSLAAADRLIALSEQWRDELFNVEPNANISVLYNPCFIQPFRPLPLKHSQISFLFMGRMGKRKGCYDLIEAFRNLSYLPIQLRMYGDGDVEEIKTLVSQYKLDHLVTVKGWISNNEKAAAFNSADVLILPSYNEGLPIAILEALSYSMPIITTSVGGIREAVEDQQNGLLLKPGSIDELAAAIETFCLQPDLIRRMGKVSHQKAKEKFDIDSIMHQLLSLYQELNPDTVLLCPEV